MRMQLIADTSRKTTQLEYGCSLLMGQRDDRARKAVCA